MKAAQRLACCRWPVVIRHTCNSRCGAWSSLQTGAGLMTLMMQTCLPRWMTWNWSYLVDIKRLADIIRRYVAESVSGVSAQIESLERRIDALPAVDKEAISGRIDDLHNKIDEQADKIKGGLRSELFDWALDFKSEHEKSLAGLHALVKDVPVFDKSEVIDELKAHIDGLDFSVPDDVLEKIFERQSAVWQLEYERRFSAFLEHAISRIPTPDDVRALDGMTVEMQPDGRTLELDFGLYGRRTVKMPNLVYRGIWKDGQYERGDAVTWAGSLWIAEQDTMSKPSTDDSGWRLAVKKGRAGEDGSDGKIPDGERLTAREVRTLRELLAAHEARK